MGVWEFYVREHERDLQGLLDGLLRMKPDDVVIDLAVLGERPADIQIARSAALEHLGILDLLRTRRQRVPRAARDRPSCPGP